MSSRLCFKPKRCDEGSFSAVKVDLEGRFMLASKREYPCLVAEMSTVEMLISTSETPELGEFVIVYIAELGRFEGNVERHEPTGFAIAMSLTSLKHQKLAEQLVWFASRSGLNLEDKRRHRRIVPLQQLTAVHLENGKDHIAKINDISASGVSIEISVSLLGVKLHVGSHVVIGKKGATIIRVSDDGFVARFDEFFEDSEITEALKL